MALPLYEMLISDDMMSDLQVSALALVDKPAIEKNFLAFKDKPLYFLQEERFIISGPAMLADTPIYRRDAEMGEYNVVFRKDTIYKCAQKFFEKGLYQNINLFHEESMTTTGVHIFESFITDKQRGIQPMKGFEDAPEGSWFMSARVDDMRVWQAIKQGQIKGFSVEGMFSYKRSKMSAQQVFDAIAALLEDME